MIRLSGQLICWDTDDLALLSAHLSEHIHLSRAERGCKSFDITPTGRPLIWAIDETFVDRASFEAHKTRTRSSIWWQKASHTERRFQVMYL